VLSLSAGDVTSRDQSRDSCASAATHLPSRDVTDAANSVPASGPRASSGEPRDHRDDDVTTTTSGSYSVDGARQLCSEIDEMFFTNV